MVDRPQKDDNKKKKELKKMPQGNTAGDSDNTTQPPVSDPAADPAEDKPKKKRRRRRRRKKKKPEDVPSDQSGAPKPPVDETSQPELLEPLEPVSDEILSPPADDLIGSEDFSDDLPLDDTVDFSEDGQLPDVTEDSQNSEDAVWDQYDPQKTDDTAPVDDLVPEGTPIDESSTQDASQSEKPPAEPAATETSPPPVEPKPAPAAAPEEGDIPDWLKAVPPQDWSAPADANLPQPETTTEPLAPVTPVETAKEVPEAVTPPPVADTPPPVKEPEVPTQPEPMVEAPPTEVPVQQVPQPPQVEPQVTPSPESSPVEQPTEAAPVEPEVVEAQVVEEQPHQHVVVEDKESFSEILSSVLKESGISLKTIITWIVVTLILIFAGYYLISNLGNWFGGTFDTVQKPVSTAEAPVKVPVDVDQNQSFSGDTGLTAGEQVGYWFSGGTVTIPTQQPVPVELPGNTGVESGQKLGAENTSTIPEGFQQYIFTLREMQNAFNTDIYELMDKSQDRYTVLINHINLMKLLEARAQKNLLTLNAESQDISQNFDTVTEQKNAKETLFFSVLRELNPIASQDNLTEFIALGKQQLELKAHFNARKKIIRYHQLLLENLTNRRRDYELNKDALVKGVKVVDVKGSDINLILAE